MLGCYTLCFACKEMLLYSKWHPLTCRESWIINFPVLCFVDFRTLCGRDYFLFNLCSVSCHGNAVLTVDIKGKYHSCRVM